MAAVVERWGGFVTARALCLAVQAVTYSSCAVDCGIFGPLRAQN